ncbi:MAG: hypothetical protein HYY06_28200 [Deltaproteobacteria bacterium]|nr:hypothetical protein [Deltaproteobacteria bacterium]
MRQGRLAWIACAALVACYSSEGPGPTPADCTDEDGDGYGSGLDCAGPDCDDGDASRTVQCARSCEDEPAAPGCACDGEPVPIACYEGPAETANIGACSTGLSRCRDGAWSACEGQVLPSDEVCNTIDDDCDGVIDDGVLTPCGDCNLWCELECVGVGCEPFVPGEGASLAEDGALIVAGTVDVTPRQLWVTSASSGTVTRVDTDWLEVTGRFRTGPAGGTYPVAVAMNEVGDALVVDSHGGQSSTGLTRILSGACPDVDGDGIVESSSSTEMLDWGEDECVGWQVDLEDCEGNWGCGNGAGIALTEEGRRAWVSLSQARSVVEVDAEAGELTGRRVDLGATPMVIAADARGNLWATTYADSLYRIPLDDPEDPEAIDLPVTTYTTALDVDDEGRVAFVAPLGIYDPSSGESDETYWSAWDVAVGMDGSVWAADTDVLRRYDPDSLDYDSFDVTSLTQIAIDLEGNVWTLDQIGTLTVRDSSGEEIDTLLDECEGGQWGGGGCAGQGHLEGDPTGIRFRRAFGSSTEAETRHVFESACASPRWMLFSWQAEGGEVAFGARASVRRDDLEASSWADVGAAPPDSGSAVIEEALEPESLEQARFLEVRAILRGPDARLLQIAVTVSCGGDP